MKITILSLTRNRPLGIIGSIKALHSLASDRNVISYVIRYDEDDAISRSAVEMITRELENVVGVEGPRPLTPGEAWNDALAKAPEADAYTITTDQVMPITPNWDEGIRVMVEDRAYDAFSWNDLAYQGVVTLPVLSRKWVQASGHMFVDWFPFWFADTWFAQVYELAKGEPVAIASDMRVSGRRARTMSMRDVAFWIYFWKKTRGERVKEAEAIRLKMGWPKINVEPIVSKFERLDTQWNPEAIEREHGTAQPPSERYVAAKRRAEEFLSAL